ncbi:MULTISPECIES: DUF1120 domain-containing protein [unclassified Pseudomonas]|uniref:DUF1120 domain-containing protein n=1 Tax=unclassified Pseudomonas TaxID=196821 RepID=UPI0015ADAAE7|nr:MULTISPECIES: DUF1120 domain-containing protein [unclassified Pseudomonas]
MKKCSLLLILLTTQTAMAATSTNLAVTGLIEPPSCDIAVGASDFDVGDISVGMLSRNAEVRLPDQTTPLTIVCAGPTLVGIRGTDNRAGTASSVKDVRFGLGLDISGNKIGWYEFEVPVSGLAIDGQAGFVASSDTNGTTWASPFPRYVGTQANYILSFSTVSSSAPSPFSTMSGTMRLATAIAPYSTLNTSAEIHLDGSATLTLIYL